MTSSSSPSSQPPSTRGTDRLHPGRDTHPPSAENQAPELTEREQQLLKSGDQARTALSGQRPRTDVPASPYGGAEATHQSKTRPPDGAEDAPHSDGSASQMPIAAYPAGIQAAVQAEFHIFAGIQDLTEGVEQLRQQPHSAAAKLTVTKRANELAAETAKLLQRENPDAAIDVSLVVTFLLNLPPSTVQEQLRELQERNKFFLYQIQQEDSGGPGAAGGSSEAPSAPPASTIFAVSMMIARLAFATAVGSLLGGPAIAIVLSEPLFNKAFEGAVSGLLGGLTSEMNELGTAWANCLRAHRQQSARQDRDDRR